LKILKNASTNTKTPKASATSLTVSSRGTIMLRIIAPQLWR
jgi:hypothetical protein